MWENSQGVSVSAYWKCRTIQTAMIAAHRGRPSTAASSPIYSPSRMSRRIDTLLPTSPGSCPGRGLARRNRDRCRHPCSREWTPWRWRGVRCIAYRACGSPPIGRFEQRDASECLRIHGTLLPNNLSKIRKINRPAPQILTVIDQEHPHFAFVPRMSTSALCQRGWS